MRIGVLTTLFPTIAHPTAGIYVKEELDHLSRLADVRLIVAYPNHRWFAEKRSGLVATSYPVMTTFALSFPRGILHRFYPASLALSFSRAARGFFDGCDVIHAHNGFAEGVAAVKAFYGHKPVVVTVHGTDVNMFAMKPSLRPSIISALNDASHVICVGTDLKRKLTGMGVSTAMTVVPNGIDTELLGTGDKYESAAKLGLDPVRKRVLFAGNFVPVKGIEYLIRAVPAVLGAFPDCEFVLVGAHPGEKDRTKYRREIDRTGAAGNVRIVDRVPHETLPLWMRAADVLAVPSLNEGFGLVAAEALACGRPVVATRSGGPEDIVVDRTGRLVPTGDPDALAEALISVLNGEGVGDAEFLAESAGSRFSYEVVTRRLLAVLREASETVLRKQ